MGDNADAKRWNLYSDSSNNFGVFRFKNATIGWVFREGFEFKDIV